MNSLAPLSAFTSPVSARLPELPTAWAPQRGGRPARLPGVTEAPLDMSVPTGPATARHSLSLRWLGASVLVAVAGSLLLGSAIFVSSDGDLTFAESPERAPAQSGRRGDDGAGNAGRKGDKLLRAENVAAAKQSFRTPMTLRAGDREVIKVRNFVRIATNLSMTSGVYSTDVPPFNPLRLFTEAGSERLPEAPPETSDAEVSVLKSDLTMLLGDGGPAAFSDEQVGLQLQEEARLRAERRTAAPLPPSQMLARILGQASPPAAGLAIEAAPDAAFRSIEVRVVAENVTTLPKPPVQAADYAFQERLVPIRRGETLDAVLRSNGAAPDDVRAIAAVLVARDRSPASLEGMQLRLLVAPTARPGEARRMVRAILFGERGVEAIAAMNDRGAFVSVAPPQTQPEGRSKTSGQDDDEDESGITLYDSLYETALKQELPRQTIEELIRVFGYDVDFQRRVTPGDAFELFYAQDEDAGDRLEILTAAITLGSDVHRVYRFQSDDGTVEYFDEAGRSLKKFLIRKPVVEARMSSSFGVRYHPILGYSKMHSGVDWAAKVGTPIFAAGNGTVTKAQWDSGYGRRTELQHANGYVTTYNHQSAFARGIVPGAKVRQGQVIGYVGSTGLSTGAHLHYEVVVNGHFVDPMKIRVPRGRELDGRALNEFGRQRDQIDQLLLKANPNRLAQRDTR